MTPATSTVATPLDEPALKFATPAVVLERPHVLGLQTLNLIAPGPDDVVVEVEWSGISTGTERLLYRGTMPAFPGLAYPLVPGYESVGRVVWSGADAGVRVGETVFVPGARCFEGAEGLFGGAARRLVVAADRVVPVPATLGADGVLLALAATAYHALGLASDTAPLIVPSGPAAGRYRDIAHGLGSQCGQACGRRWLFGGHA
jgi:bacteriochlorophyllide a dehydrogenase